LGRESDTLLVVELLSPGTEDDDLGRTPPPTKGPPTKWEVYEKILQIPYYVVFSRYTNEVQFFKLTSGRYVKQPLTTQTLWLPEVQLGLGLWKGKYDGLERQWLRWSDANGLWLPTSAEQAKTERQRAIQAEQETLLERQRAVQAEQRSQQLAAQLRALGIDPDQF